MLGNLDRPELNRTEVEEAQLRQATKIAANQVVNSSPSPSLFLSLYLFLYLFLFIYLVLWIKLKLMQIYGNYSIFLCHF